MYNCLQEQVYRTGVPLAGDAANSTAALRKSLLMNRGAAVADISLHRSVRHAAQLLPVV